MAQKRDARGRYVKEPVPPKRGGAREGAGRPAIGSKRVYGIVMPDEEWEKVDILFQRSAAKSYSEFLRDRLKELVYAEERNSQSRELDEYGY